MRMLDAVVAHTSHIMPDSDIRLEAKSIGELSAKVVGLVVLCAVCNWQEVCVGKIGSCCEVVLCIHRKLLRKILKKMKK